MKWDDSMSEYDNGVIPEKIMIKERRPPRHLSRNQNPDMLQK